MKQDGVVITAVMREASERLCRELLNGQITELEFLEQMTEVGIPEYLTSWTLMATLIARDEKAVPA